MSDDQDIGALVYNEEGGLCLSTAEFIAELSQLFEENRHVIDIKNNKVDCLRVKCEILEDPQDENLVRLKETDMHNENNILERTISVELLVNLFKNARFDGLSLSNEPELYDIFSDMTYELHEKYYKDSTIPFKKMLQNSNSIILKNNIPILVINDFSDEENVHFYNISGVWGGPVTEEMEYNPIFYINFNVESKKTAIYSPYQNPDKVLFDTNDLNNDSDAIKIKNNNEYSIIFFSKLYDTVIKINLRSEGIYFDIVGIQIVEDYENMKDYVMNHYGELSSIFNEFVEKTKGNEMKNLIDFID